VLLLAVIPPVRPAVELPNPIVVENQRPGTDAWQLGRQGFQVSDDAAGQIKGYASRTSVKQGRVDRLSPSLIASSVAVT
jgi:hypothetical protein